MLYQATAAAVANAVVACKNVSWDFLTVILCLKKRRSHRKAIIAIARMLLTAVYPMLKNGKNYKSVLYIKADNLPIDRGITVDQAIIISRNQGYKINSANA